MSHTVIASCTNSSKDDDTLIIIVNSDGTLSVDPETLQKLLANQHHNSPISLVRLDAKGDSSADAEGGCDDDDDPDSRVNLTVEGYYPPTPAPSSPTPPPTPVPDTNIAADGGGAEILADSALTEILQPEDVEKLETALQSEHAKEILGDVVLDMLQKNGEETATGGMGDGVGLSQQGSVVLDHCYASLTGPAPQTQPPTMPATLQPTPTATPTRGTTRGRGAKSVGRGRGMLQGKLTVPAGATLVPVVEQLVMPSPTVSASALSSSVKGATVALQRVDLQQVINSGVVPCKVMLNKVPTQSKPIVVTSLPQEATGVVTVKAASENEVVPQKKKGTGRGRGGAGGSVRGRGRGQAGTGRGRGASRISQEEEARQKQLADEMAATVRALNLAEAEQFAQIESMDQSSMEDSDRVIPLVNKAPAKKPVKVYRRMVEVGPKTLKVLKPEKMPQKPRKKSVSSESSSHDEKPVQEQKKEEKVIVVSMEPQITPAVVSAVVMSQSHPSPSVIPAAPVTVPTPTLSTTPATGTSKKYPKRENRKPPAHLAEAFGPALFSTPDIIRRVSDKPNTPTTPGVPSTPSTPPNPTTPATPPTASAAAPATIGTCMAQTVTSPTAPVITSVAEAKLEDELGLAEPEGIMDTISSHVAKQEDQLLAEALLLDELSALPTQDILQEDIAAPPTQSSQPEPPPPYTPATIKKQIQKPLSQTSLSVFFPKINQKDEVKKETVAQSPVVTTQVTIAGVRKLPPIELPATRGATKRATQQKEQPQESQDKTPEVTKKLVSSIEKRKSTDSKKSTESKKSAGREDADDSLVSDEISDDEGSYNSEDDPNRLWCICKRPHNNRFMICCDFCEDWFHGKCVGVTKAMGEQMEEKEIEWMCPNCKKKKKQEEAAAKKQQSEATKTTGVTPNKKTPNNPAPATSATADTVVENPPPAVKEKKPEASKVMVQHQKLVVLGHETPKSSKGTEIRITKVTSRKSVDERKPVLEKKPSEEPPVSESPAVVEAQPPETNTGVECIVCKKEAFSGGVYCSDECIAKHVSESLSMIDKNAVIVFEKKTGRIYGGPNGPTPGTLTSWLMAHPSYEVMRPGVLPTSKYYNQPRAPTALATRQPRPSLKQTVLQGQNRSQGIQLIAALPQLPPVEGPLKKNMQKSEPSPTTPKPKPQPVAKGQQQITTLLKAQQAKQQEAAEAAIKTLPVKSAVTPPAPKKQQQVKEPKKVTPQPPPKKITPTVVKKVTKEEEKVKDDETKVRGKEQEEHNVRASVRKTLQDILTARLQEVDDLKLTEDQIKKITIHIEEELHALFKDTNAKYKAKYRSLMFNIKDKNNLTLFRKIADKSISPEQLVRLSPEELASQELAQWREREARHQLEMIKKTELDMMQQAKTVVMKTHKGEQVVENEDGLGAKVLETSVEIEPVINITTPTTPTTEVPAVKPKEDLVKEKEEKHGKKDKDKKEEKHKERRHSSHHKEKGSHHKEHHKSHSRHRSRYKSESDHHSKSKSPEDTNKNKDKPEVKPDVKPEERERSKSRPPERSRSRHRHSERERSKSRPRERSKSRPRERSKSRARERSKSRPRENSKSRQSRPRERSKSRPRERSKSRPRERSKSKHRERSTSKDRSRSKSSHESRSKSETRSRSKSRHRERSKSKSRKISQDSEEIQKPPVEENKPDEPVNIEKVHEGIDIPAVQPAIFDAEVKEIIHDLVVEEEIGPGEEDLSDREPSSTVNITTPPYNTLEEEEPLKPPVWKGTLLMPDVAMFTTSIQEVSGICEDLAFDLPETINCVGRISPETAWDYIAKMKKSGTKQILVIRFSADNEEDKMSYLSFYSYLSSRNRLGVVGNNSKMIKDFYILPLPSHSPVPQVLLPLDGPGFEDYRPHLLLGIIVRTRRKRLLTDRDIPFVPKVAKKSERSYTPPLPDEGEHTPTAHQHPVTESFTPPHSPKPPRVIKLKPKISKATDSPTVSEDFVIEDGDTPYTPEDEEDIDTPYSPGEGEADRGEEEGERGVSSPPCSAELQRKVDELNRLINDIEERKLKIDSLNSIAGMSPPREIIVGTQEEDDEEEIEEAYSPSGSITPPVTDSSYLDKSSTKISLPSDLQEIIASIKKKPEEPKSLDLKLDPIVQAYRSADEPYSPEDEKADLEPETEEKVASPASEESLSTQSSARSVTTTIKVNRDPRQRPQLSLSQLSDEEIMKKASEMGFMNPENPEPIPDKLKCRMEPGGIDEHGSQIPPLHPPPMFMSQQYSSSQPPFGPDFPPPPPRPPAHMPPPAFPPPAQFQSHHMYQTSSGAPLPPLPPSHIPFTNPQPPPPQPMYPPPPQQPAPLPPPPPSDSPDLTLSKKKLSKKKKKSRDPRSRKEKKEKRKYSESPPPKDYDYDERDKIRDRDRYSSKKREKRETWRTYEKSPPPEKRRDSWEYDPPPPAIPPPQVIPGPPAHTFVPGPMRGLRGRFQRGMRGGFRRGFDRPPMRGGFHRGGFHKRGHHVGGPPPGPSRIFTPKNMQSEYEEDIRRFEEQRLKQKNLERRRWRNESPPPRKRRGKDSDSD